MTKQERCITGKAHAVRSMRLMSGKFISETPIPLLSVLLKVCRKNRAKEAAIHIGHMRNDAESSGAFQPGPEKSAIFVDSCWNCLIDRAFYPVEKGLRKNS